MRWAPRFTFFCSLLVSWGSRKNWRGRLSWRLGSAGRRASRFLPLAAVWRLLRLSTSALVCQVSNTCRVSPLYNWLVAEDRAVQIPQPWRLMAAALPADTHWLMVALSWGKV